MDQGGDMKKGDPIPCSKCDGDGEIWTPVEYDGSHFRECENCDGTGVELDPYHRRAYLAISQEAGAVGWPMHYREDLTVHDRGLCEKTDPSMPFAWILRESGTHLMVIDADPADRSGNTVHGLIRNCFGPGSWGDAARFYKWDGHKLREVENHEALARWAETVHRDAVGKYKRAG